jgi:hypothetical protein
LAVFDGKHIAAGLQENPLDEFPSSGVVIGYKYLHGLLLIPPGVPYSQAYEDRLAGRLPFSQAAGRGLATTGACLSSSR